tara:strand:+ start:1358 stop:3097 length:1740 start_codon:yes stop_codon:yes gene_type:complete
MKELIVTDHNNYTNSKHSVLYINKYSKNSKDFSLLGFIDKNSLSIKKQLKEDIRKISNKIFKDKVIEKHRGFNFLYNFFLYDRSIYKYPSINEYIKIIGIRKFFDKKKEKFSIRLKILNKKNLICIEKILQDKNIRFENIETKKKILSFDFNFVLHYFRIFKFISKRIFLKPPSEKVLDCKNFIVSYLAYVDKRELNNDSVKTVYWGDIFKDNKKNFFLYIYNENIQNNIDKVNKIQKLKNSNFLILDSILTLKDFFIIIFMWFKLTTTFSKKKKQLIKCFNQLNHSYKLFHKDIENSLFGFDCFINVYYFYLFHKLSEKKITSTKIFYLAENQGWEKSLNYFLKKKSKKIFAVISTPVRYWDTRYIDQDNFLSTKEKKKYLPDFYLVNGNLSKTNLKINCFKDSKIMQVEALRYDFIKQSKSKLKNKKNFLITGDYNLKVNEQLESLVIRLSKIFKKETFFIKEHPNLKFGNKLKKIKNCRFVYDKSISELSNFCGKAIVPSMTSAGVDAVMNNLKTVVVQIDGQINFSPLKGVNGILHEKDDKMIINYFRNKIVKKIKKNYFLNLDLNKKLWKKIIR